MPWCSPDSSAASSAIGVADVGSDSDTARFLGILIGSIVAAAGVGIVAVLVLRAMAEWNRQKR